MLLHMLVYVCVCVCTFVCACVVLTMYEHAITTLHHCVLRSHYFVLPIQLIGIALIICGIIMCVVLVATPELQPLDVMMIVLEIVLFFTGALLTIAFSVFALVAAHIRSRVLLLAVSCLHSEWMFLFCVHTCVYILLICTCMCVFCVYV